MAVGPAVEPLVDVLIPTYRRKTALAMTLTSLLGQTFRDFRVTVADQTPPAERYIHDQEIRTIVAALRWHGHDVRLLVRDERRGLAEQRAFLLAQASAPYVHYLDDDVVLAPDVMQRMLDVIVRDACGFVGAPAAGLDYLAEEHPEELRFFERWDGPVGPETFPGGAIPQERHHVNSGANPLQLERLFCTGGASVRYKVAWVGGANVLYDRRKLEVVGGFDFWRDLPVEHAGEEALVQFLLLERFGGCGILPCGTYHQCLPTTVPDRRVNATSLHAALRERFTVKAKGVVASVEG